VAALIVSNRLDRDDVHDLMASGCEVDQEQILQIRSRLHKCTAGPVRSGPGFVDITYNCKK
jgi:hypothetical protein